MITSGASWERARGQLLLVSPGTGRLIVADLNCDLAALTPIRRRNWFVGAYSAALFAITDSPAHQPRPPAV